MNKSNKNLRQKLLKVIKLNDIKMVKMMLEKNKINLKFWKDPTEVIIQLLKKNYREMPELLMKQGVILDINCINKSKVLILSSISGYTEIVKLLLDSGANPNIKDENGSTVLIISSEIGYTEIVKLLLDSGANPNVKNINKNTALICSSENGNEEIVKLLLDLEIDLNAQGENGYTALIAALGDGNKKIIKLLLDSKANLDLKNIDGTTALMLASENENEEIVKLLLDSKANPDIQNKTRSTALIMASETGNKEIVKLLLDSKSDPNIQDETGNTALIVASENGEGKIVKLLLDSKSDPNIQDEARNTALIVASKNRSEETQKFRLDPKLDFNIENEAKNDWASLVSDSNWGYKKIIEMLLENGANLNIRNDNGVTALMILSECGEDEILDLIINYQSRKKIDIKILKKNEKKIENRSFDLIGGKKVSYEDEIAKKNEDVKIIKHSNAFKFNTDKSINNKGTKNTPKIETENLSLKKKIFIVDSFFKSYFAKRLDKEEFETFLYDKGYEILNAKDYKNLGHGNRIKKLRTENNFFELRINRGDRIIFTFKEEGIIFLCVDNHDSAVKRGKNKEINNLIKLSAKIEDISGINTSEIIENPIFEYNSLKEIEQTYESSRELYKLTEEQENIINKKLPICLYGSAGSGKTIMLLKKIEKILRDNGDAKILFLTHNKRLLKHTKGLYETYSGYKLKQINFNDVNEFFKQELLFKDTEDNYFSYKKFKEWFTEKSKYNVKLKKLSILEVFSEIKGIIKGFIGFYGKRNILQENIISKEYYTELKNKYSLLKNDEMREVVYSLAVDYEKHLKNKGYYDENDLAIKYLREKSKVPEYDFLVCDEVQDLTELQILSIFKAIKNKKNAFLTGDNNQAINLSFFDFGRLETLYRENYGFKDLENSQISLNQRSNEKIVKLAKEIAKIREETLLANKKISYREKIFIKGGNIPILAPFSIDHLSQIVDKDVTVIVPSFEIKAEMEKVYENTILTIYESKGMERENIVCVGLIDYFKDDVEIIVKVMESNSTEKLSNHYRHFFNLFYVATTRAKKNLVFLDDIDNRFFNLLEGKLYKTTNKNWLDNFIEIDGMTGNKLLKYAKEFEKKGLYSEALKNYRKIKNVNPKDVLRVESFLNFENKNYEGALVGFDSLKMWKECSECTTKLKDEEGEKKYQIKLYKNEKNYLALAKLHYLNLQPQLAFDSYIKYFREVLPESNEGNQMFFDILPKIEHKNIAENDKGFIINTLSEKPGFSRLAIDILVIDGKYKKAKELLELQVNKSIEDKFKLFLLESNGVLLDKKIDELKIRGEQRLYKNYYISSDIPKLNSEILRKMDIKTLDLFIENETEIFLDDEREKSI